MLSFFLEMVYSSEINDYSLCTIKNVSDKYTQKCNSTQKIYLNYVTKIYVQKHVRKCNSAQKIYSNVDMKIMTGSVSDKSTTDCLNTEQISSKIDSRILYLV